MGQQAGRVLRLTTLHLIRHAEHGLLGRVLAGRMPGLPLSPAGQAQASRLAQSFVGRPIAAIVSSPLQRAQDTAAPIAAALGLPVRTEPGLNEIDFGSWTGAAFDALHGTPEWRAWNQVRSFAPCPGGESMVQAQTRALDAITRLRAEFGAAELILVSHSDILKSVLSHALGIPLDLFQRITLDPASRSTLVLFDDDARVDGVNLPCPDT